MRSFEGMRRWLMGAAAVSALGCGMIPVKLPVKAVDQKDFITPAKAAVDNLYAEYTLAKGLVALTQTKVDEFLYIENGLKLGKVQWKTFRDELEACFNSPIEAAETVQARTINATEAAQAYKGNSALHELQAVKDTGWNAVNKVKACPQALTDQVKGLPKKPTDEAKAWARQKLEVLNELRVLAKDEAPKRGQTLGAVAQKAVTDLTKQLGEANAHLALAKQMGDQAVTSATQSQVDQINGLLGEVKNLSAQAPADATALGKAAAESVTKIRQGFTDVYGKRE